jgi:hypothetical protein
MWSGAKDEDFDEKTIGTGRVGTERKPAVTKREAAYYRETGVENKNTITYGNFSS